VAGSTSPARIAGHAWAGRPAAVPVLLAAMETERPSSGMSGRIVHRCWVLDYTFTPGGRCRAGGPARPWGERPAGVGHLYPPDLPYWEDTRTCARRVHSAYVTFLGGEAAGLEALTRNRRGYARLLDPEGLLGQRLLETTRAAARLGEAGWWLAQSGLLAVVHLLRSSAPVAEETRRIRPDGESAGGQGMADAVAAYLRENLARPVALAEIAEHLGVSVSSLSHRYRAEAGETPMATRTRLAVGTAKALLLKGWGLKHIAVQTGFCDAYHLSKAFKRAEGRPPREWLRNISRESR
jgi:AraC-like DNA-binding protein